MQLQLPCTGSRDYSLPSCITKEDMIGVGYWLHLNYLVLCTYQGLPGKDHRDDCLTVSQ